MNQCQNSQARVLHSGGRVINHNGTLNVSFFFFFFLTIAVCKIGIYFGGEKNKSEGYAFG